jgi:ABC-type nitrate/sulfonate/bicarbonate transport system substrate-binding protein
LGNDKISLVAEKMISSSRSARHRRITPVRRVLLWLLVLLPAPGIGYGAEAARKTYLITSSMGDKVIPYIIAQRLGFYVDEGFQLQLVLARASAGIQGLVGGSADYINHSSATAAILRGLPLRILLIESDKPAHYVVTSSKITSFKDLHGKIVGVDDVAGNAGLLAREILNKNGIKPSDVKLRVIGPPAYRLQALLSGTVDATLLNYVMANQAQSRGYRILAFSGDFVQEVGPSLVTSLTKIKTAPEDVYGVVKATLKGILIMYQNPQESMKYFMEVQAIQDVEFASAAWQARLNRASDAARAGTATREAMLSTIEQFEGQLKTAKAELGGKGSLTPELAFDFSFADRAYRELKSEGWDAKRYTYKAR